MFLLRYLIRRLCKPGALDKCRDVPVRSGCGRSYECANQDTDILALSCNGNDRSYKYVQVIPFRRFVWYF